MNREHYPASLWRFCDCGAVCKSQDLLTYFGADVTAMGYFRAQQMTDCSTLRARRMQNSAVRSIDVYDLGICSYKLYAVDADRN